MLFYVGMPKFIDSIFVLAVIDVVGWYLCIIKQDGIQVVTDYNHLFCLIHFTLVTFTLLYMAPLMKISYC